MASAGPGGVPLAREAPLLPEPVVQNELTVAEREAFLASFDNEAGFRAHLIATTLASRSDRKHQPPNAQSNDGRVFILALYTGLRRSDLRLLQWTSVDLTAGVIRLVMRKTKRPVLLRIVLRVRAHSTRAEHAR